jgi:hypothetical protein
MIEWNLKWRRKDVYQNTNDDRAITNQSNNYFLNADLQEHYERLARLGLPAPVIEPDYEVAKTLHVYDRARCRSRSPLCGSLFGSSRR